MILPQEPYGTDSLTCVHISSTHASNSRLSIVDSYAFSCLYLTLRYSDEFFHGRMCMHASCYAFCMPSATIVGIVGMRTMLSHLVCMKRAY